MRSTLLVFVVLGCSSSPAGSQAPAHGLDAGKDVQVGSGGKTPGAGGSAAASGGSGNAGGGRSSTGGAMAADGDAADGAANVGTGGTPMEGGASADAASSTGGATATVDAGSGGTSSGGAGGAGGSATGGAPSSGGTGSGGMGTGGATGGGGADGGAIVGCTTLVGVAEPVNECLGTKSHWWDCYGLNPPAFDGQDGSSHCALVSSQPAQNVSLWCCDRLCVANPGADAVCPSDHPYAWTCVYHADPRSPPPLNPSCIWYDVGSGFQCCDSATYNSQG